MANPATLTEDDEAPDGGEQQPAAPAAPAALRPASQPPIRPSAASAPEEEFEVLEVDDQGKPFEPDRGTEGALSEADAGGETLVEQRQRESDQAAGRQPGRSTTRKQAQREAKERREKENRDLRRQLADQAKQIEELNNRFGTVEPRVLELGDARIKDMAARLDADIVTASNDVRTAQQAFIDAWDAGDKVAAMEALTKRDDAVIKKTRLENAKAANASARPAREDRAGAEGDDQDRAGNRRAAAPERSTERQPASQQIPRDVQRFIEDFSDRFDWYDPKGTDRNSRRVLMLDNEVASDGFKPNTQEYWDELESRMREVLPANLFDDDGAQPAPATNTRQNGNGHERTRAAVPQTRRGPMTAGGGDRPAAGANGKTQVRITPERKTAMMQAGIIGEDGVIIDQTKYTRVLKQYLTHDRANGAARP